MDDFSLYISLNNAAVFYERDEKKKKKKKKKKTEKILSNMKIVQAQENVEKIYVYNFNKERSRWQLHFRFDIILQFKRRGYF